MITFLKSSVCHFESPDKKLEAFLNHELTHNQKDLKAALTATQALSLHYAEQLQKREVAGSLLLGAAVGGGGEVNAKPWVEQWRLPFLVGFARYFPIILKELLYHLTSCKMKLG